MVSPAGKVLPMAATAASRRSLTRERHDTRGSVTRGYSRGAPGRVSWRDHVEYSHCGQTRRRRRSATVTTTRSSSKATPRTQMPGRRRRRENVAVTRTGDRSFRSASSTVESRNPGRVTPTISAGRWQRQAAPSACLRAPRQPACRGQGRPSGRPAGTEHSEGP